MYVMPTHTRSFIIWSVHILIVQHLYAPPPPTPTPEEGKHIVAALSDSSYTRPHWFTFGYGKLLG